MSLRYDTYGFRNISLEDVREAIEGTLGVKFNRRNSGYYAGDYYMFRESSGGGMKVYNNRDEGRDIWIREKYNNYSVVLEIFEMNSMEELKHKLVKNLSDIVLLESEILDDDDA